MRLFKGTLVALALSTPLIAQSPPSVDWSSVQTETMQHSQALLQLDTSDPPGNESLAATYLQQVQQREGIPVQLFEDRAALGLTPADDGQLAWECCPER